MNLNKTANTVWWIAMILVSEVPISLFLGLNWLRVALWTGMLMITFFGFSLWRGRGEEPIDPKLPVIYQEAHEAHNKENRNVGLCLLLFCGILMVSWLSPVIELFESLGMNGVQPLLAVCAALAGFAEYMRKEIGPFRWYVWSMIFAMIFLTILGRILNGPYDGFGDWGDIDLFWR